MVSFENFVKSMTPSLLELKVTPSVCFAFKIPDDVTATNMYISVFFQDRERDAAKSSKVPLAQMMNAFSQLCWIEKQYYSLTYLTPKRFLMKDVS